VKPNEIIIHENFSFAEKTNDIALIRLEDSLDSRNKICLPIEEKQDIEKLTGDSAKLTIAGWGRTENTGYKGSDVLMKAVIDYLPREECSQKYSNYARERNSPMKWSVIDTQICANGTQIVDK
jgi:secreted trypsin-like serine protease